MKNLPSAPRGLILAGACTGILALNITLLPPRFSVSVPVEIAHKTLLPQIVRAGGTVEPKRSLIIKAEFEGPVLTKLYKEGVTVKEGELLLVIGRNKIQLEHENKVIALENAKTDLARARKDAKVQKALFRKGAVAQSNVEDAERAVVRAVQTLKVTEEDFQLQEERWNKNKIYAAFDGTLIKDGLEEDPNVTAGKELATLADVSEYSMVAKVDELEIGQIQPGQRAEVQLQSFAAPVPAHVTEIGSQAEANGLTEIPVVLKLDALPGLVLRPKLTGTVHILTGQYGNVLSIPLTALFNANGETRIWIVDRARRLRSRKVLLGQSNPDRAEITQGLEEGERVCAKSDPQLVEGLKVNVAAALQPPGILSSRVELSDAPPAKTLPPNAMLKRLQQLSATGKGPPPEVMKRIEESLQGASPQRPAPPNKQKDE